MSRKFYLLPFLLLVCHFLNGQNQLLSGGETGTNLNVLYRNEAMGKVYIDTRGYGAVFRKGKQVTAKTRSFYEIDAQNLRHPKEVKVSGEAQDRKRFVYGKINGVFLIRAGLGLQHVIFTKADSKAIEVRYSYSVGPSLAFVKPYYVQVIRNTNSSSVTESVKFNPQTFTQDSVIGRGTWTDGLAETKIYPALNAKFNLSFEYASYTNIIRAIELGATLDYFPKALPIMARNPSENIVITLHIGFVFGKKWF